MRQAQCARPVRCVEIMDIDPVVRHGACGGHFVKNMGHCRVTTCSLGAVDEEVETAVSHAGRKPDGLYRARLADQPVKWLQIVRVHEAQRRRIATASQIISAECCGTVIHQQDMTWAQTRDKSYASQPCPTLKVCRSGYEIEASGGPVRGT